MTDHEAKRTLVKSPPELWAECSDAASLARHLGEFGEIRITRLEPESTVAWEGELASGTVRIEPSAWGTKVTLTAQMLVEDVAVEELRAEDMVEAEEPRVEEVVVAEEEPPVAADEPRVEVPVVDAEVPEAVEPPAPEAEPPPGPPQAPAVAPGLAPRGLFARMRARWAKPAAAPIAPAVSHVAVEAVAGPEPVAAPEAVAEREAAAVAAAEPESVAEPEAEPVAPAEPVAALPEPVAPSEPEPVARESEPAPAAAEPATGRLDPAAALVAALDSLGQAHHRPFSRA